MYCDMLIIAIVGKLNYNTKYMLVPFLIFSLEVLDNFVGGGGGAPTTLCIHGITKLKYFNQCI